MASEFHVNEESWNPKEYFQGCDCWVYKKQGEIVGAAVTENTKGKPGTNYATLVHSCKNNIVEALFCKKFQIPTVWLKYLRAKLGY